jgi:hypothetical protein
MAHPPPAPWVLWLGYPAHIDRFGLQRIGQHDEIIPTGKIVMEIVAWARCYTSLCAMMGKAFLGQ